MALKRMTLAEIMATQSQVDWAKVDSTTEDDIRRHMIEDGEDPDEDLSGAAFVTSVSTIRLRLGMTQEQLAVKIGVPVKTLRNWEQHRVKPDPAARALLRILDREPEAALRALARRPAA